VAGKSIGKLSIGVDLDAGKAQQGLATLSAEVNALGSAITNMGKNFASSFAAGFGVGSLSQIVSDLGSKLAELVKYTYEFQTKMEAASLRLKDAFSVGFSQDGLKNLMAQTNLEIDELAARLEKLGNLGSGRESAGQIVRGAQIMDPKFGGDGKSQEALIKTLEKLRSQFTASDKDFESFARRGYKVYEQLAQVLGVSADEAPKSRLIKSVSPARFSAKGWLILRKMRLKSSRPNPTGLPRKSQALLVRSSVPPSCLIQRVWNRLTP